MFKKRTRLQLEQLEDRCVPALSASLSAGSLMISGTPTGELDIVGTPANANSFRITDNGHAVGAGTYTILSNLTVSLTSRPAALKFDLNGNRIPGNVLLALGSGYSGPAGSFPVDVYDDSGLTTNRIGGTLQIINGNGHETVYVGVGPDGFTLDPVTVAGATTVSMSNSNNVGPGNGLIIGAGSTLLGSVGITKVENVAVGSTSAGSPLTYLGVDLTINNQTQLKALQAVVTADVGRNLNIQGTQLDDSFTLQDNGTTGSGLVHGSMTVSLYDGQANGDQIFLGANTRVMGPAGISAGANTNTMTGDQFSVFGEIDGTLTVNMGNNTNSLYFRPQDFSSPMPFVGNNMTVNAGSGTNYIGTSATGEFQGTIVGYLNIVLGSGNNGSAFDPMVIAASVGTKLYWTSGNGQDFVQLGDFTASGTSYNYTVQMQFGSNDDTLIVDIGSGVMAGTADGGGRVTFNTFNVMSGTVTAQITNFP